MRRLLVIALAMIFTPVTAHAEPANCGSGIDWIERVYDHTDMTCAETRWVYNNRPGLRDEFPGNHIWISTATKLPSPAIALPWAAAAATSWCKITTTEKYRAPIIPFGDHVLFSFTMSRTFSYNGSAVSPGTLVMDTDTTANGFRWHFDGITLAAEGWIDIPGFPRYQYQTDRWAGFSTDSVSSLTTVHSTLHDKIWFQANGDWATMNTEGAAGCQN